MIGDIRSFGKDPYITFKEDTHQYFDPEGKEYKSFSKTVSNYYEPFDAKTISSMMARGNKQKQKEILKGWEDNKNRAIDHGNNIHHSLENYDLGKMSLIKEPALIDLGKRLSANFSEYYRVWPEVIVYSKKYGVAGQIDKAAKRQSWQSKLHVIDFYDYKTNLSQGIRYDSIGWNKEPIKHYNKFMLNPLDHLEDCNYSKYSIQLSSYAFMSEITYGVKVGKLFIIFISLDNGVYNYKFLPVPYMRMEVMAMFEDTLKTKKLPSC